MKRTELAATRRLLAAWRGLLVQTNHLGVETDDLELLEGLAEVRDYIIGQIDACERRLKIAPENAQFATLENRADNARSVRS